MPVPKQSYHDASTAAINPATFQAWKNACNNLILNALTETYLIAGLIPSEAMRGGNYGVASK